MATDPELAHTTGGERQYATPDPYGAALCPASFARISRDYRSHNTVYQEDDGSEMSLYRNVPIYTCVYILMGSRDFLVRELEVNTARYQKLP